MIVSLEQEERRGLGANEGLFANVMLSRLDGVALNPFLVIGASDDVVTQHSIYSHLFINFLREFLQAMEGRRRPLGSPCTQAGTLSEMWPSGIR